MKTKNLFVLILMITTLLNFGFSQGYHVRVAFVGNSITAGDGLSNPSVESYPARVTQMLEDVYGDTCIVYNSGVSGRTMLKHGDYPIWSTPYFKNCWFFAPDILFICLGTNDSKPQNWDVYGDEFLEDYQSMVDTFKRRNPNVQIIVCYPPPAFAEQWGIRDSVIVNGVFPVVDSIRNQYNTLFIDYHAPLLDSASLFPDQIHPNAQGALAMANIVFDTIMANNLIHQVDTGYTFINSATTDQKNLATNDTAIISWTTINADSMYFDGQPVAINGSMQIIPNATTTYELVAVGSKNRDTIEFTQNVYIPELNFLAIEPAETTINLGDSVSLHTICYDQYDHLITSIVFETDWSIYTGSGTLTNATDTSVNYISTNSGKSRVKAESNGISNNAVINVNPATNLNEPGTEGSNIKTYPNPCDNELKILCQSFDAGLAIIKIYNVNGSLQLEKSFKINSPGPYTFNFNTSKLIDGCYFYKIEGSNKNYSGSFTKITN